MDVLLAPDVYVNASVALGSPPEKVVQRLFGKRNAKVAATPWIMERVRAMLAAIPEFRPDALDAQIKQIQGLVSVAADDGVFGPDAWEDALVAAAKGAKAERVITDHPDLLALASPAVEFISTESWLFEQSMPPPAPPGA